MSKLIKSICHNNINVNYRCKSIYAKNKGKRCTDIGTDRCMTCNLCQAEMSAYDANKLMESGELWQKIEEKSLRA